MQCTNPDCLYLHEISVSPSLGSSRCSPCRCVFSLVTRLSSGAYCCVLRFTAAEDGDCFTKEQMLQRYGNKSANFFELTHPLGKAQVRFIRVGNPVLHLRYLSIASQPCHAMPW